MGDACSEPDREAISLFTTGPGGRRDDEKSQTHQACFHGNLHVKASQGSPKK